MRRGEPQRARGGLLRVGLLLAAVVTATTFAGPWNPPLSRSTSWTWTPFPPGKRPPPPAARPPRPSVEWAGGLLDQRALMIVLWTAATLAALLALAALLLLVPPVRRLVAELLARRPRRGRDAADVGALGARTVQPDLATLGRGVTDAGVAIAGGHARPADAVVAAWVELERAAAGSGVRREPASTATEFTVAVLDATPADRDATRTLLGLYLRARFGTGTLTADDVRAARAALARLEAGLTQGAPAGPAGSPA